MKKLLLITLLPVLIITTVFIGCKRKPPAIGIAIFSFNNTFMSYTHNAIERNTLSRALVTIVDSKNNQALQNEQVDEFIANQMKAIAVNPVDRLAAGEILNKAIAADIPVIFFNREPLAEVMNKWDKVYYVGAKAQESGIIQGRILFEYWNDNPDMDTNKDGILQYIMIKGEPGHQDTELRTEYSIKELLDSGVKLQELAAEFANWDRDKAAEIMNIFIKHYGNQIEAVICNNDEMAMGVIDSLRKAGYFTGSKYLPVIGVDATPQALQAIAEGALLGTVLNDAKNQGKAILDIAIALALDKNPAEAGWNISESKYIWVPYQKVTKDNYWVFE